MTDPQSRTLVLASTSPFRRELLQRLTVSFETFAPEVDESRHPGEPAQQLVTRLAEAKARAAQTMYPDALVIGSDQVAVCQEDILGKPGNHENACKQLARLAGHRVNFLTGLCLFDCAANTARVDMVSYHVTFRIFSAAQIDRYLRAERPYNCAGSFKSEGLGISLFQSMEGEDPTALIGLPLITLVDWLNAAGIAIP